MSAEQIPNQQVSNPETELDRGKLLDAVAGGAQIATQVIVGINGPVRAGEVHDVVAEAYSKLGFNGQTPPTEDALADRLRNQSRRGLTLKIGSEFLADPEFGEDFTAIAGYMGSLSVRSGAPPLTIMGGRGRSDKKHGLTPGLIRHRINQSLRADFSPGDSFTVEDMVGATDLSERAVAAHLKQLRLGQLVVAERVGCKKMRYPEYELRAGRDRGQDELEPALAESTFKSKRQAMAGRILEELAQPSRPLLKGLSTADNLWELFIDTGAMEDYTNSRTKDAQLKAIEKVLHWLAEEGFIRRVKNGSRIIRSYSLTEFGDKTIAEYLEATEAFVERDPDTKVRGLAEAKRLLEKPHNLGWLLHSEHRYGLRSHRVEDMDAFRTALQHLLKHPEGMTTHALAEIVGKKPKNMASSLRKWAASGLVKIADENRRDRIWSI